MRKSEIVSRFRNLASVWHFVLPITARPELVCDAVATLVVVLAAGALGRNLCDIQR